MIPRGISFAVVPRRRRPRPRRPSDSIPRRAPARSRRISRWTGRPFSLSWLEPAHARVKPQDGDYALRMCASRRRTLVRTPSTIAEGKDFVANGPISLGHEHGPGSPARALGRKDGARHVRLRRPPGPFHRRRPHLDSDGDRPRRPDTDGAWLRLRRSRERQGPSFLARRPRYGRRSGHDGAPHGPRRRSDRGQRAPRSARVRLLPDGRGGHARGSGGRVSGSNDGGGPRHGDRPPRRRTLVAAARRSRGRVGHRRLPGQRSRHRGQGRNVAVAWFTGEALARVVKVAFSNDPALPSHPQPSTRRSARTRGHRSRRARRRADHLVAAQWKVQPRSASPRDSPRPDGSRHHRAGTETSRAADSRRPGATEASRLAWVEAGEPSRIGGDASRFRHPLARGLFSRRTRSRRSRAVAASVVRLRTRSRSRPGRPPASSPTREQRPRRDAPNLCRCHRGVMLRPLGEVPAERDVGARGGSTAGRRRIPLSAISRAPPEREGRPRTSLTPTERRRRSPPPELQRAARASEGLPERSVSGPVAGFEAEDPPVVEHLELAPDRDEPSPPQTRESWWNSAGRRGVPRPGSGSVQAASTHA